MAETSAYPGPSIYRAIGVRPTDLPGKSARYRDLPVGASVETLCHGLSRSGAPLDASRCQRGARLADLRGVGPAADRPGAQAVSRRGFGVRPRQYGLRARFDDHRSLPGGVSVGAFPHGQGGGEDLRGNIPSFIHISDGKLHDVHALDLLLPEAGAIYVMDRGYVEGEAAGLDASSLGNFCRQRFQIGAPSSSAEG